MPEQQIKVSKQVLKIIILLTLFQMLNKEGVVKFALMYMEMLLYFVEKILLFLIFLVIFKNSFLKKKKKVCIFLAVLGLSCCVGFSLVVVIRGYSPVLYLGFLLSGFSCSRAQVPDAWASVIAAPRLQRPDSVAMEQGLNCSTTCGILPHQA